MILEKALESYKLNMEQQEKSPRTVSGYMQDLSFFRKWLEEEWNGPVYLEDIEFKDVDKFVRYLKEERDYKPASRKRMSVALKMFFKYAWKKKLCAEDIASQIEGVKCIPNERDYLTEEEALAFIKEIGHPLVEIFTTTLFYTGMRISEALSLTLDDVDINGGWIHVREGKGRKSRKIPICKKLEIKLTDYMEWRVHSNKFFATEKTGGLSAGRVQAIIRETRIRLGCKKQVTAHMFRHSFASQLVKNDVNIVSLSKLLGHSNLKTTSIYTHVSKEQLVDAINML
ncbi:MAG: tyrosine-type recombinase/integrase [Epulopiscium sp.]|nr:tyrosine-type recombinase/integrase [Candidatus Epulonipiscium sp.]